MPPPALSPASTTAQHTSTSLAAPTLPPQIELRQNSAAPSNKYVTLSITRDYTTYTTTILLAGTAPSGDSPTTAAAAAATTTTSGFLVSPATTTEAISSPSKIPAATSTDPSSSVIIGAIVGSIVGSFFVLFLIWICFWRRPVRILGSVTSSSSSSSSGDVPAPAPRPRTRVRVVREVHERRSGGGLFGGWGAGRRRLDDD